MALQHLRSSTANKRPLPAGMSDGQLAINTNNTSPGLFFKDSAGALVKVGPVHVGTTAPNASPAGGGETGNSVGEQWLDTTGSTYVFKVWDGSAWRSESGTFVDVNGDTMTGALGIIAGTAGAPGLFASGDTNTGIYSPGADQLSIATGGTERLRIDSTGQIESVSLGTAAAPAFSFTGDPDTGIYSPAANELAISTNGTGRLFVDSSGRVLAGANSTSGASTYYDDIVVTNTTAGTGAGITLVANATNGFNAVDFGDTDAVGRGRITYSHADDSLRIDTAGSERLRITSDGKLGLGTSSPSYTLDVTGSARITSASPMWLGTTTGDAYIQYGASATTANNWTVGSQADGSFRFFNGTYASGTERLRITSDGKVGVGTTSPGTLLHLNATNPVLRLSGSTSGNCEIQTDGASLLINADSGNTVASSNIAFRVDNSEKARIDSSGRLLVGTSTAQGGDLLQTFGDLGLTKTASGNQINFYGTAIEFVNRNATAREMRFYVGASGGSPVASLSTAGVWTDASDISNKTNIKEIQYGIAAVKSLLPRQYDVISDGTHAVGFVAQEVQNVIPEVVNSTIAEDGTEFLGLAYGQLTAVLTKALQEAVAKVESLEARLTAAGL